MLVTPFRIDVPDAILADSVARLDRTRLADEVDAGDWARGTHRSYLASLVHYWRHEFDWRAQEAKLNELPHRRVHIDGVGIHFIHERGRGPAPLPMVLTHGYPDSFVRFLDLIPLLTDPAAHGGDAADAFDVVVPSLPGYGFSDRPTTTGPTFRIGDSVARADDRGARLRALRRARRRLGQHGHRAARAQPRRRRSSAST